MGMSRQQAIKIISQMIKDEEGFLSDNTVEAHKMAIKALEQETTTKNDLPHCQYTDEEIAKSFIEDVEAVKDQLPTKNDSGVDCISRADAIRVASGYCHPSNVAKELAKLPSVTPQERTGHWIEKDGFDGDTYYDCSECGESWTTIEGTPWDNEFKYCPNCGARMEVEDNG